MFSPPLLSTELDLTGFSGVIAGSWLSFSTTEDPATLPVPTEVCLRGSGLLCAPASESLSSLGSFPWLLGELSPILRWLKARSQCVPNTSLPLVLSPLRWLRALSPIKALASSASSPWPQINWALCSASWSPAALKSLWSCHRFTLLKMFAEPAFLLLLSDRRHNVERPANMEEEGEAGPLSIQRNTGKGGIHGVYAEDDTEMLTFLLSHLSLSLLCIHRCAYSTQNYSSRCRTGFVQPPRSVSVIGLAVNHKRVE